MKRKKNGEMRGRQDKRGKREEKMGHVVCAGSGNVEKKKRRKKKWGKK